MASVTSHRAEDIFQHDLQAMVLRTDRMFSWLLLAQWAAAVVVALAWSPRTWIAQYWSIHQHVLAATLLGGLFAAYPLYLIHRSPGSRYTRHMIAIGQMLQSALLVHVSGGRIETHFHVFGSLALLAFYRDWPVLVTASLVVYADHLALGVWFPLSVYGITQASMWRSVEHAFWVVFEVVFLTMGCRQGIRELRGIAEREAKLQGMTRRLEESNRELEQRVHDRTKELEQAKESLEEQVAARTRELNDTKVGLETTVSERTCELQRMKEALEAQVKELEFLNSVMMGREERILDLKEELQLLRTHLGMIQPTSPPTTKS